MSAEREIQRIHPYSAATINHLETWLSRMADDGWKLKSVKGWRFSFIKCQSSVRQYFMYLCFDSSKGFFDEFYHAKRRYSLRNTSLNRSNSIFEVDLRKADQELNNYYSRRNKFYSRKYGSIALLLLVFELLSCFFAKIWGSWVPAAILALPTVYFIICFVLLIGNTRRVL